MAPGGKAPLTHHMDPALDAWNQLLGIKTSTFYVETKAKAILSLKYLGMYNASVTSNLPFRLQHQIQYLMFHSTGISPTVIFVSRVPCDEALFHPYIYRHF